MMSPRFVSSLVFALTAAGLAGPAFGDSSLGGFLHNRTAYIPPQCYTKTLDDVGRAHNPCFTCHLRARRPNFINDPDLQLSYAFPGPALSNPWSNLFEDRRGRVAAIGDEEILSYIRTSNYQAPDGSLILAGRLADVPPGWDVDGDGIWGGYTPDCHFRFDDAGFDIAPDGTPTGWRAFAYTPLPGSFSPASGSTDDVLIRLPEAYRQNASGEPDQAIYEINLAIVEALIARRDVSIAPADEKGLGVDLDRNGSLGTAEKVVFDWAPLKGHDMSYVGRARTLQEEGKAPLAAGLFPLGTEFLHTVRYVDVDDAGEVRMAARLKELRYMRKTAWQTYADLEDGALEEIKEDHDFPDRVSLFDGNREVGIANGTGWRLQGFIEDRDGALRPQSFEETVFCIGCHGGIGVNDDSTLAFARKLEKPFGGWFHWSRHGLRGIPDPKRPDGSGEYARYLAENGAGDEFRDNAEIIQAFIGEDGKPDEAALAAMAEDLATILYPSRARALALNKAYRTIVMDQDFVKGRDPNLAPAVNVHREVEIDEETGIKEAVARW
ncbi:hypothetical protein [Afifella marina]|nr:hypothetical protein [Afifella marina]MBK1622828.1 hypothetical protein [Afifella marina DSM 2698]MBK1625823.1 hypothetical protein [Afifella marina]MBK5917645.1 hypothetical protein [Afifella marina]RAI23569.1 hypothetical protein CH311_01445 [Afifella marina DSM 2698]